LCGNYLFTFLIKKIMKRKTPLILGLLLVLVLGYALASRYLPVKSNLRDQPVKVAVATNSHPLATNNLPAMPIAPVAKKAGGQSSPPARAVTPEFDLSINPYAGSLKGPGKSKRAWDAGFLQRFPNAANGDPVQFELTTGQLASGIIHITQHNDQGELTYLSGELTAPEAGKFFFLKPPEGGKAGKAVGVVEFPASQTAYRIEPTGSNGAPELWQRRMDEVLCVGLPPVQAATAAANMIAEAPPLRPDTEGNNAPGYNTNQNGVAIISLQSYPGSKAVLLLDFFGGYTPTWNGIAYSVPAGVTSATIKDVWKRVAEDYLPFNINVTTDIKVYQAAPAASRQRCCFTDTPVTAAGVAYVGSWNWGSDTPCWSVYTTGKNGAEVGAHEPGHTLGLSHETQEIPTGVGTNTTHNEYYAGQGSGATGWAPTMGAGYYQPVSSWSKGEFQYASNPQDELNTIATANNNVTYRADDTGSTLATSRYLEIYPDASAFAEGVIETAGDTDAFQFTTTGGPAALQASPAGDWANLAMSVTLADANDILIASNNPQTTLSAMISTNLPAGTYTFRITGAGRNDPVTNGFSSYASVGYYSISGFVTGGRLPTRLAVMEQAPNGTVVGPVVATDTNSSLAYAILSGNPSGAFSIDDTGMVRVANAKAVDYTTLATNTVFPVQFEMYVNITNLNDSSLTELNRRVIISVQSRSNSYPIAVTGYNAGLIAPYNATVAAPKATAFDLANGWCFYQAGLFANAQVGGTGGTEGMPQSGSFISRNDGATFQFGPYGGTNALIFGQNYPSFGKLTFTQPRAYNSITILAASANGGGLGTCSVTFTNGLKSKLFNFNDQDWFNTTTNVALMGFGRLHLGQATLSTENPGFTNPNLYQTTLNLAALGSNLMVAAITFTNPAIGGNQDSAVFAVSGQPMPDAVSITQPPSSLTNTVPTQAGTLTVVAMGAPTLACQWYQGNPGGGTPLANQTNFSLTFTPVQATNAGNYYAIVTNSTSSATSAVATVAVYRAPQIVRQTTPTNTVLFAGQKTAFSISAIGAAPLNYYWIFNGTNISGAVATNYALNNLQLTNTGNYSCLISNAFGIAVSTPASLAVIASNYPCAQQVIKDHPLGYWRLDETSGSIAHDCISTNNGIYAKTLLNQAGDNLIDTHPAARFGSAINSYVGGIPLDFGTTNYTSKTNGEFSVECWVNGGTPATDAGLITKGTGGGGEQVNLDCGGNGHAFRFFVRNHSGSAILATGNVVPDSQWHHLVGVCNQSNGVVTLYVDGLANATGTLGTNDGILDSTSPFTFGSRQSGSANFDDQFAGRMEEVAIYNYPLSAAQVLSHYVLATNRAPVFAASPFTRTNASAGQSYAATLAGSATDPNGDPVTYGKVSGPAWLSVASNGSLAGTPANADANTNTFMVSASDPAGLSNTASLLIYVNGAPSFLADPFSRPAVVAGQGYSASLAAEATDPNPTDILRFGKVSGPDWLVVGSNGALTGRPFSADAGTNRFVISVSDPAGLFTQATMTVVVTPAPVIAPALTVQNNHLLLDWSGGIGPFQVQMNTDLATTNWQTIATNLNSPAWLVSPTNNATFYRVSGQ
jgi:hypothetical protein